MRAVQAALSGETRGFEAEFRVRHKDGTYRWMLSRGVAVRNAAGIPVRFIGSDVDTTDLKRAEAALRESEQRFRTFVDHASDAFFLLDERMADPGRESSGVPEPGVHAGRAGRDDPDPTRRQHHPRRSRGHRAEA